LERESTLAELVAAERIRASDTSRRATHSRVQITGRGEVRDPPSCGRGCCPVTREPYQPAVCDALGPAGSAATD
jgi:hypothetical protein